MYFVMSYYVYYEQKQIDNNVLTTNWDNWNNKFNYICCNPELEYQSNILHTTSATITSSSSAALLLLLLVVLREGSKNNNKKVWYFTIDGDRSIEQNQMLIDILSFNLTSISHDFWR